jgi:hypothetical protein
LVPRLRIFLSSPADTNWERLRAHLIIRRLARDYRRYFTIEPFWGIRADGGVATFFQDAVDAPGTPSQMWIMNWPFAVPA